MTGIQDISPRQAKAITALLGLGSVEGAARATGISVATLWRWQRNDPAFASALREARQTALDDAYRLLQGSALVAVLRLKNLLNARSEQVQLAAARALLDNALKVAELQNLEERISALEAATEQTPRRTGTW